MARLKKTKKNVRTSMPAWTGRYPFPPEKKRPVVLRKEDGITRLYGKGRHRVATWLHVSTDCLSCTEFVIQPGRYTDPPDVHSGDEVYYVLDGTAQVFNPDTGFVVTVEEGDALLIPKGTWHQVFNFGDKKLRVICSFAPTMWSDDDMGTTIKYEGKPKYFNGKWKMRIKEVPFKLSGNWPISGKIARKRKELVVVKPSQTLNFIQGKESHILISFLISNNFLHVGTITIPANVFSEPEVHKGDEVIYCLKGEISVSIQDETQDPDSITAERLVAKEGERIFIPKEIKHQYLNLSDQAVRLHFIIAPKL